MFKKLSLISICALSVVFCANADVAPMEHTRTIDGGEACTLLDQSRLAADSLECFEAKIDLSEFDINTTRGMESAKSHLRQVSHSTCRIRNPNPSAFEKEVYRHCRSQFVADALHALGVTQSEPAAKIAP